MATTAVTRWVFSTYFITCFFQNQSLNVHVENITQLLTFLNLYKEILFTNIFPKYLILW